MESFCRRRISVRNGKIISQTGNNRFIYIRRKLMYHTKIKGVVRLLVLLTIVGLALQPSSVARAADNTNGPELPAQCDSLQVPAGNMLAFHVYARGVQIYRWNGASWEFVAPMATLFADADYHGQVGIHYAGPTWESNSGSKVVAASPIRCFPDPTSIPWLRLQTASTNGPGIFSSVTYVQRVNTTGGLAPTASGSSIGEAVEVPYTAEYYFYRADD
jgi:hypothetical protein